MFGIRSNCGPVTQVDDAAAGRLSDHVSAGSSGAQQRRDGVDLEVPSYLFTGDVLKSCWRPDRRTVDQNVEPAKVLMRLIDDRVAGCIFFERSLDDDRFAAETLLPLRGGLLGFVDAGVGVQSDVATTPRKLFRDDTADSRRTTTRDDGNRIIGVKDVLQS